jgi:hypothetical protein
LPAVLALVLAVLIAGLFGALLAFGFRRLLTAFHFDESVRRGHTAGRLEWSFTQSPTPLFRESSSGVASSSGW